MQNKNNNKSGGYTIIETMIAVSLFVIIVMAGMGSLLNANLLQQKSQRMRSIIDSLSFVMEDMSKNLRTGYNYQCLFEEGDFLPFLSPATSNPKSCPSGGWGIVFEYANGDPNDDIDQWVYYIYDDHIYKTTAGPNTDTINYVQLTPAEVVIDTTESGFFVDGAEPPPGDSKQPFVTIKLVGTITFKNIVTPFTLQTSVSQRQIDI